MFNLTIQTDNAEFDESNDFMAASFEVSRILKDVAASLSNGTTRDTIRDINGNKVGEWSLNHDK
jgi:hypothetical protein